MADPETLEKDHEDGNDSNKHKLTKINGDTKKLKQIPTLCLLNVLKQLLA